MRIVCLKIIFNSSILKEEKWLPILRKEFSTEQQE